MLETIFNRAGAKARLASSRSGIAPLCFFSRRVIAALGLVLLSTHTAIAQTSGVRELDIADYRSYLAADHPARQGMRKFADLVGAGSAGKLHVNVRSEALPGSPGKQIAAFQAGAPDAPALMLVAATGLAAVSKEFGVLDLPFLVRNEKQADALLDGAFGDALLGRLAAGGLAGLGWWENGFRQMTTSGAPIIRADGLQGLRFRVIGEPVFIETFRAMGANPVPLPFGELYAALKSKSVDAQDNFYSQILAGRLHEVQSSLAVTNHSYSAMVLVANAKFWGGLTATERRVLKTAAIEAGRFQRHIARDEGRQARAQLIAHGMVINELAPSEMRKLLELTEPIRNRYFGDYPNDLRTLYAAEMGRFSE
jgi:tripartite ATP-independent transporter DctP family solute receptor